MKVRCFSYYIYIFFVVFAFGNNTNLPFLFFPLGTSLRWVIDEGEMFFIMFMLFFVVLLLETILTFLFFSFFRNESWTGN